MSVTFSSFLSGARGIVRRSFSYSSSRATLSRSVLAMGLLLSGVSCQKGVIREEQSAFDASSGKTVANATLREYSISPATTDPNITTFLGAHFASVNEGGALKNTLFLFIPGTYRIPSESKGIQRKAASLGYHTIGISYPNTVAGNPLCKGTDDITCHRRARQETIDGIDRHPSVNVNPTNSIINRVTKLLVYLNQTYPAQNWGQYLTGGNVNWSKVIVCGHSQGGSLAGVIGKMFPIKKVIVLSMIDFLESGRIPDWQVLPDNKEKYYALTNTKDELVPYDKAVIGWGAMGMTAYGGIVNIGSSAAPYQNTHTLITTVDPTTTLVDKYHNGTAIDTYIPKDASGKFIYDQAWEYLINGTAPTTPPAGNQVPVVNAGPDVSFAASSNPTPTLNGNSSKDPDGYIAAFAWTKESGPATFTIETPTSGKTRISNLVAGVYVFRLSATDNKGAVGTDDVQVTITGSGGPNPPSGNQPPVVAAGADLNLPLSSNPSPTLNGTTSKDPDGYIASFAWTRVSGPTTYTIATPNAGKTKISNLVAGTYIFRLTATDNKGLAGTDDVSVRIY